MEDAAGIYARIMFPDDASKPEPHLSDLRKAMLDATPDCIKVVSVDGELLAMNRAGCRALNLPENSGFGMAWLPLLPDDVQLLGRGALHDAAHGRTARFPGRSTSSAGTVYWDNLLTPVVDASGKILSILCVSRDVTEKVLLERQLTQAVERERLLSREMHHRIKNLFSVVSGLVSLARKEAASEATPDASMRIFLEKLEALSRASGAVFAEAHFDEGGTAHLAFEPVVRSVLAPYGDRCGIVGSAVDIRHDDVTTFALLLHELATNAIKYGALSASAGNVLIRWTAGDGVLDLTWIETGGPEIPDSPRRRGFGTEMVDRIVRAAGGTIRRTWRKEGLVADLRLPNG